MIEIRPARLGDAVFVGRHLREEDEREVWAATRRLPSRVLSDSFRVSRQVFGVWPAGSPWPCAVFGVADDPSIPGLGVVWMLCTPAVGRVARDVLRAAPAWLDQLGRHYPLGLHNLAHVDNELHARWCTRSGFTEGERVQIGGETFIHIHRSTPSV